MIRSRRMFENNEPALYDGVEDTDSASWFNVEFLNKRFAEYNARFFGGKIPEIPVKIGRVSQKVLGKCVSRIDGATAEDARAFVLKQLMDKVITSDQASIERALEQFYREHPRSVHVSGIQITDGKWSNRFFLEGTLIHEMCHAYQIEVLCKNDILEYSKDSKLGKGSAGHGPKFFEAADLVNSSQDNREGFKITQYGSAEEMSRKAYKKADGYLHIQCLANQTVDVYFVSAKASKQAVVDMYGKSYMFGFRDGDIKAKFKVSKRTKFRLTDKYVRDIEEAIINDELFLYAVNEYGVWDRYIVTERERINDLSQFITYFDVVDCALFGVTGNDLDLEDLLKGSHTQGAKWLLSRINYVVDRTGMNDQYVSIYPETFRSMFAIPDEDSIPYYGRCLNQPATNRVSLSDVKRLYAATEKFQRFRRRFETTTSDLSDKVDDALFSIFSFDNSDVSVDRNGDIVMEVEHCVR